MPPTQDQIKQYQLILQAYHAQIRSIIATHKVTVRRTIEQSKNRKQQKQ
ncbi:MAG: hypothetical protein NUV81_04310 [bacterium]|nr:hypothetical protein [bacterium]